MDVPRETRERLDIYANLLLRWNRRINLVGRHTEASLWERHFADSLQLAPLLPPGTSTGVDLGSGAGFPGLVLAIASGVHFHLIEADQRKAAFLREVAAAVSANVVVHASRAEDAEIGIVDVVTARAVAPLKQLLRLSAPFLGLRSTALFLKGEKVDDELTDAEAEWQMKVERHKSLTDPRGMILRLTEVHQCLTPAG